MEAPADTDFTIELESNPKETDLILKTKLIKCPVCTIGDLVPVKREKEAILVYGTKGTKLARHREHRCNNKNKFNPCRVGAFHGYITHDGNKIYDPSCLKDDILVVSNQTAFERDFLIEIVSDVQILSACFEGIAKKYNRLNNRRLPSATLERWVEVCRKRITDAYFLFSHLEYGQRYGVEDWEVIMKGDLEKTILEKKDAFQCCFRERWTIGHKCDVPGCEFCVIIDADMKPQRMLCAAKACGVREFKKADVRVLTGCTAMPETHHKLCFKHQHEASPIVTNDKISSSTKEKLRSHRKKTQMSDKAQDDEMFVIESVKEIKNNKFLIKWSGFVEEASTWEASENVPKFIQKYYKEDNSRLGTKLPNPKIKYSKKVGNTEYHFLSWEGVGGGEWLKEDFFEILGEDGETVSINIENECNTRKSRDKRTRAHTAGLFVAVKPCGTVVLVDELYGCESISQVYGIMIEWLGNLSDMKTIQIVLYDDNCHLGAYSENPAKANRNEVTKHFASLGK